MYEDKGRKIASQNRKEEQEQEARTETRKKVNIAS